jgi:hypothetical protein
MVADKSFRLLSLLNTHPPPYSTLWCFAVIIIDFNANVVSLNYYWFRAPCLRYFTGHHLRGAFQWLQIQLVFGPP